VEGADDVRRLVVRCGLNIEEIPGGETARSQKETQSTKAVACMRGPGRRFPGGKRLESAAWGQLGRARSWELVQVDGFRVDGS
jgi:hypothetical protein